MSSGTPTFEATDQGDLLDLLADPTWPISRDDVAAFLAACERDAATHDGIVSVNRVSRVLDERDIEPHRYSAFWSHFTGKDRPMLKATTDDLPNPWEVREGSKTGNNGKPFRLRRWVGTEETP